jgi:protein subunit release factor A
VYEVVASEAGSCQHVSDGTRTRSNGERTFNYPQDRITDHRCKQSEHGIEKILSGSGERIGLVGTFAPYLRDMERKELLAGIEEDERIQTSKRKKK